MFSMILALLLGTNLADGLELTEKIIDREFEKGAPTLDRIEMEFLNSKQRFTTVAERFGVGFNASGLYQKSKERSFYEQDVILSPLSNLNIGVNKKFKYGFDLGLGGNVDQVSSKYFSEATSATMAIDLSIDLYKDIFGRLSRHQVNSAKFQAEKAGLKKEIDRAVFRQGLKKIYWGLVANNESLKISKELLETSARQLKDAKKRFKESIADSGEVARYESQVASRKATIIGLEYQRENYWLQLKELLPQLADQKLELGPYDLGATVFEVMGCTATIGSKEKVPLEFTLYDEILELVTREYKSNRLVARSYSRPDIKLHSQYLFSSKEFGYRDAFEGLQDDPRAKYQIGLTINFPLDGTKKDTREVLVEFEKRKYLAEYNELMAKVRAHHQQTVRSIDLLNKVSHQQQVNSEKLQHSLKVTKKKYDQARISVGDLTREQDSFLASKLDEIQTKLMIITTLLDYLAVYTQTPCSLNRK